MDRAARSNGSSRAVQWIERSFPKAENLDGLFQANLNEFELQVGDTVKLEAAINPASGFSQEKVERTTTVVEE